MNKINGLIYIFLPDGKVLFAGNINIKDMYHFEAMKILVNENNIKEARNFMVQLDEFYDMGYIVFLNYSIGLDFAGQFLLPNKITEEQKESISSMPFNDYLIYIYKNGLEYSPTEDFNLDNYYGKTLKK